MTRKYAIEYIDRLMAEATYQDLVNLSSVICSSPHFNATTQDYGLPQFAFLFSETLLWFAQATRSGVWTYYEATSQARQGAMASALRQNAPEEFASRYEQGMRDWRDETRMAALDNWIKANDEVANEWLRVLVRLNRESLLELTAE